MRWVCLFLYEELNFDWTFDPIWFRVSPMFVRLGQYFDFIIVSAENGILYKYLVQNGKSKLIDISEVIGNSVLILGQNS